jgi:hypothetical protein
MHTSNRTAAAHAAAFSRHGFTVIRTPKPVFIFRDPELPAEFALEIVVLLSQPILAFMQT